MARDDEAAAPEKSLEPAVVEAEVILQHLTAGVLVQHDQIDVGELALRFVIGRAAGSCSGVTPTGSRIEIPRHQPGRVAHQHQGDQRQIPVQRLQPSTGATNRQARPEYRECEQAHERGLAPSAPQEPSRAERLGDISENREGNDPEQGHQCRLLLPTGQGEGHEPAPGAEGEADRGRQNEVPPAV